MKYRIQQLRDMIEQHDLNISVHYEYSDEQDKITHYWLKDSDGYEFFSSSDSEEIAARILEEAEG